MHGQGEAAGTFLVRAEVEGGGLDGAAGAGELGQAAPSGVDVAVVGDGPRQVVRGAAHEGVGGGWGEGVAAFRLREEADGDGAVKDEAQTAGVEGKALGEGLKGGGLGLLEGGEEIHLQRCVEEG